MTALIVVQPVFACEPSREWEGDNPGLPVILPDDSEVVCEESTIRYSVETYKGEGGHKLNDDYLSYSGTLSEKHVLSNEGQEIEEILLVFSEYAGTVKELKIYNDETGEEKELVNGMKSFSLNPGEKVVIEILSNVRPYGHLGYVTPVYEFKYDHPEGLSYSNDAEISIMVSTVYNIVRSNIKGFDTVRSEFVLSPEDIPEEGIKFALSKSREWPQEARGINTDWGMVGFFASIVSGPFLLVAAFVALTFVFTSKK